ncbi:MAG: putative metal-binding motif-containing protein [bacterium]|nr:putative metal-binding motif-containing protein [bacterium]
MRSLKIVLFFGMCFAGCSNNASNAAQGNPDAHAEGEAESESEADGISICEETPYTDDDFNAAFATASKELSAQGHDVTAEIWENDEDFNDLIEQMILALDCTPRDQSIRRYGPGTCAIVTDFTRYQGDVAYCGSGARQEPCYSRVIPGDCLNQVCHSHDRCYGNLIVEQGPICMWSNDTEVCDAAFHRGAARCFAHFQCEFQCRLIATLAANLDLLQEIGKIQGKECLYGADPDTDKDGYSRFADRDCDNHNAVVHPGATELCDGVDNDCDRTTDEGFEDVGSPCTVGVGACMHSDIWTCSNDQLFATCPAISILALPSPEICDFVDNDCDGVVNEGEEVVALCQDGIFCNGEELCEGGECAIGAPVVCDDGVACTADFCEESSRVCSSVADNARCDDDSACTTDRCTLTGCANEITLDADDDGFIAASCIGGTDCNDGNDAINPDATELCDGVDNNCAGGVDEGVLNACGVCGEVPPEVCNGTDDDCNETIDDAQGCCPFTPCSVGQQCCDGTCQGGECCFPNGSCLLGWDGNEYPFLICSPDNWCVGCANDSECNEASGSGGWGRVCCSGLCYAGDCCSSSDCWSSSYVCGNAWSDHICRLR